MPATRAISDEAIEAGVEAEKIWLRDNCSQCGRPFATTEDWRTQTAPGARSDLCWEPDGQCSWTFSSIEPNVLRLHAVLTAVLPHLSQPSDEAVDVGQCASPDCQRCWGPDLITQSSGRGADHAREAEIANLMSALAAAIETHRDLHRIYGSTSTCGGGIGGQALTQHCGVVCGHQERHQVQNDRWYAIERAYFLRQEGEPDWAKALSADEVTGRG